MNRKFNGSLSEQIYQYLLDQILSLKIKPGDRIPETQIAQTFNVSRTPIREALRELSNDGIITLYPNKYAEVTVYDEDRVREIGITKSVLDRLAVKLAIYYGSRAEYAKLNEYAEKCYEAARANNTADRVRFDADFHWELCKIGKNRSLMELQKIIVVQVEYLQAARYLMAEDPLDQYNVHLRIIEALQSGDVEKGIAAITEPSLDFYNMKGVPSVIYE